MRQKIQIVSGSKSVGPSQSLLDDYNSGYCLCGAVAGEAGNRKCVFLLKLFFIKLEILREPMEHCNTNMSTLFWLSPPLKNCKIY